MISGKNGGRVAMFPDPFAADAWHAQLHPFLRLTADSVQPHGWEILSVSLEDVLKPSRLVAQSIDLLHLHWPDALFPLPPLPHKLDGLYERLPRNSKRKRVGWWLIQLWRQSQIQRQRQQVQAWRRRLMASGLPLLWQIHDLVDHQAVTDARKQKYSWWLHQQFYQAASAVMLHERSCIAPVTEGYGPLGDYAVIPLGDYRRIHGEPISKVVARQELNISLNSKVLAYLGTPRPQRNPARTVALFRQQDDPNAYLLVAGNGVAHFVQSTPADHILVFDGLLSNERMRSLLCAADFVINDAPRYLTSAVVRAAMSYGTPVIAYPFGSTVDMAAGALLPIGEGESGLAVALSTALRLDTAAYARLCAAAEQRNAERTWQRVGTDLAALYDHLKH